MFGMTQTGKLSKRGALIVAFNELGINADFGPVRRHCKKQGIIVDRHDFHNGRSYLKMKKNRDACDACPTDPGIGQKILQQIQDTEPFESRNPDPADAVRMVKGMAEKLGGMENLKRLIDALS